MDAERIRTEAWKRLVNPGSQNAAERTYALACDKLRQESNKEGNAYQPKLRAKYRG